MDGGRLRLARDQFFLATVRTWRHPVRSGPKPAAEPGRVHANRLERHGQTAVMHSPGPDYTRMEDRCQLSLRGKLVRTSKGGYANRSLNIGRRRGFDLAKGVGRPAASGHIFRSPPKPSIDGGMVSGAGPAPMPADCPRKGPYRFGKRGLSGESGDKGWPGCSSRRADGGSFPVLFYSYLHSPVASYVRTKLKYCRIPMGRHWHPVWTRPS